jgi:hypothetical protein
MIFGICLALAFFLGYSFACVVMKLEDGTYRLRRRNKTNISPWAPEALPDDEIKKLAYHFVPNWYVTEHNLGYQGQGAIYGYLAADHDVDEMETKLDERFGLTNWERGKLIQDAELLRDAELRRAQEAKSHVCDPRLCDCQYCRRL